MSNYPPPPPPPGYGPPPGSYGGGYGPTRSTHGKAIASLICGICAFLVCPLIGIAAVILGPQAKREIAAAPDRYDGTGMAQAGTILGWVAIVLSILGAIGFVLILALAANSDTSSSFESLAALAG